MTSTGITSRFGRVLNPFITNSSKKNATQQISGESIPHTSLIFPKLFAGNVFVNYIKLRSLYHFS